MSDKPTVFGEDSASEDIPRQIENLGDPGYQIDIHYVPGYTEQVLANDLAKGIKTDTTGMSEKTKQEYYKRFGTNPKPLPYHFVPVRVLNTANEPLYGNQQLMNYQRLGYRPAKVEDFLEDGIFGRLGWQEPPSYAKTADSRYRNWDTELWYVDGDRYRHNERQRLEEAANLANQPLIEEALVGREGVAPTFELEPRRYSKPFQRTKE